jgi:hypothetical protein
LAIIRVFRFINCFPFLIPNELTKYQATKNTGHVKLKAEHFQVYDLVTVCFDMKAKYYAQDTGNQCSILGGLIC